jgi:hypothetical protein
MRSLEQRFMEKIDYADDCWLWTAKCNNRGYGMFGMGGKMRPAHRVAYELWIGLIPEGLDIDHLCAVRHCVNPSHLEAVTHRENLLRGSGFAAVNAAKTHCPHGHEYTPENTYHNPNVNGGRICRTCKRARDRGTPFLTVEGAA